MAPTQRRDGRPLPERPYRPLRTLSCRPRCEYVTGNGRYVGQRLSGYTVNVCVRRTGHTRVDATQRRDTGADGSVRYEDGTGRLP
eukprot:4430484-Prymnesium_polylepis.1